ncbi:Isy1-like splicing factor [Hyaloraphidium curvatum]|nr:Isy1-like splicing factor [Hyaloraphidium curvatum]
MARNQEKAQSMLYRFREAQRAELGLGDENEKRPYLASMVDTISGCEKWRSQIVKEITREVARIQDPGLTDYQIRDLNDAINKLFREKHHWEKRIRELGGPNYMSASMRMLDEEGREVPGGQRGYRYFGRARELPGVKELFEVEAPEPKEKTRAELGRYIDADYYGYRDEDDGLLLAYEAKVEEKAHGPNRPKSGIEASAALLEPVSVKMAKKRKLAADGAAEPSPSTAAAVPDAGDDEDDEAHQLYHAFVSHVPDIPTQEEVGKFLLERRKKALLEKFLGPGASLEGEMNTAR